MQLVLYSYLLCIYPRSSTQLPSLSAIYPSGSIYSPSLFLSPTYVAPIITAAAPTSHCWRRRGGGAVTIAAAAPSLVLVVNGDAGPVPLLVWSVVDISLSEPGVTVV